MRTNMAMTQRLLKLALVLFVTFVCAGGHPKVSSTEGSQEVTSQQTTTNLVPTWPEVEYEQMPSRQGVSPPPFKSRRPPAANAGCRKRVLCEAARTMTDVIPISNFWQEIVGGRPQPQRGYFAALSRGLSSKNCSELYPDCSDSPTGMVLPLLTEVVGPKGFVSSFLERLSAPSAPHVPRDPGAPRPSLVMQKLRQSRQSWKSKEYRTSSDEFTPRHG